MKLTGKMVVQKSKEKMKKGIKEKVTKYYNETQTVKPPNTLVEKDDKDSQDQLAILKSCNQMIKLHKNKSVVSNLSILKKQDSNQFKFDNTINCSNKIYKNASQMYHNVIKMCVSKQLISSKKSF